jgi:hypothetical protein
VFGERQTLDLCLEIGEHVQLICVLCKDEHAAPGAGLHGGVLGQPTVVGENGFGRQRRRAVGFAGVLAGHRYRLPGRQR